MFAALLLLAAPAAPTLGEVERLRPAAAGELLLRGHAHRPIASAARVPKQSMDPPGFAEVQLVEAPERVAGGCTRRRWTARFSGRPDEPEAAAFQDVHSADEIALAGSAGCAVGGYVYVNPGLDVERAFRMLGTFERIASGTLPVSFTCRTVEHDALCASEASIRGLLARTPPWVVTTAGGSVEIWLRRTDATVTEVRFEGEQPSQVSVLRKIPAPF